MASHVTPTFLLKGLDFKKLVTDYQSGFFFRVPLRKEGIKLTKTSSALSQTYGNSNLDSIFQVKDKYNTNVVIATTAHTDFEVFNKNGGKLSQGGRCDHCKQDIQGTPVGYPVKHEEVSALVPDGSGEARYRFWYVFWTEGRYCDFQCCLAGVKKDQTLHEHERLLKLLYRLSHPKGGVLVPAQDARLLLCNGGSLTTEQWKDVKHDYVSTDCLVTLPVKREFIRQDFN